MLVQVKWDNEEKTIVRYILAKGWGWADLNQAFQTGRELIISVPHKVDIIMDYSNASILPQNALSHIQRVYKNPKPANAGVTVIVSPSPFFHALMSNAQKVMGTDSEAWSLKFVQTNEEALELLGYSAGPNKG